METKMNKKYLLFMGIAAFAVICIILCTTHQSKLDALKEIVENGGTREEALEIYSVMDNQEDAIIYFRERAKILLDQYNAEGNEEMYNEASTQMQIMVDLSDDSEVTEIYQQLFEIEKSKASYSEAISYEEENHYEKAILAYQLVIGQDSLYSMAIERLEEVKETYRKEVFAKIDGLISQKDYEIALTCLRDYYAVIIGKPMITTKGMIGLARENKIAEAEIEQKVIEICDGKANFCEEQAENLEKQGDYKNAADIMQQASDFAINRVDYYSAESDRLNKLFFEQFINQAKEVCKDVTADYKKALEILEPIYKEYPNESIIVEAYEYYSSLIPTSLCTREPDNQSTYFPSVETDIMDSKGNIYDYGYKVGGIYVASAHWFLHGEYNLLKGIAVCANGQEVSSKPKAKVRIYGDGILLWEKNDIRQSDSPILLSIDISGVNDLEIYMQGGCAPFEVMSIMVADLEVQKIPQ